MAHLIPINTMAPRLAGTAFVAPTAVLSGNVVVGTHASAFRGVSVRGDSHATRIVAGNNLQDNAMLHADAGSRRTVDPDPSRRMPCTTWNPRQGTTLTTSEEQ